MQHDAQRRADESTPSSSSSPPSSAPFQPPASAGSGEQRRLVAVYPGSFDPVHRGHLDIAKRAAKLVDELIVAVYATPNKNLLFSLDERVALWREAIDEARLTNVRIEPFTGLTVTVAQHFGAQALVRGLRAVTDFESEFQQALMNRKLAPEIETLMIVTALHYLFISSSLLKEVARLDGDLEGIVTPNVARAIREKLEREKLERAHE